jgi:Uncharacterized conserved protein
VALRTKLLDALRDLGQRDDNRVPLAESALLLAALNHPDVDLAPYHEHLADIAMRAAERVTRTDSVVMQVEVLRRVLVDHYGYRGDTETYDDLRNADLIEVIDRRRGLPVALGILYIHAVRAYDGEVAGISFPSHFLIRLTARGQHVIIDPFYDARTMLAADLRQRLKELQGPAAEIKPVDYATVRNRDILIRLQNNIKTRTIAAGDLPRALDALEAMTALAPDRSELWWETAMLQSRLGNVRTAIDTLETYLAEANTPAGAREIEELLQRLRGKVN